MDDYLNAVQQQIAQNNAWSAEQAQKQMDFQREMSNTAHQREIEDLKAAGLNPVLSARLGGASTPSGAMADVDNSGTSALAQVLTKVLDIQNENAKALQAVANNNHGYATSSGNSAEGLTSTDVSGALGIVGIKVPNSAADVVASLVNGVRGIDNGNNKADTAYKVGTAISEGFQDGKHGSIAQVQKRLLESDSGKSFYNNVSNVVDKVVNTVKSVIGTNVKSTTKKINQSMKKF